MPIEISHEQLTSLQTRIAEDPEARAAFIADTRKYLESLGIEITDEVARQLEPETLAAQARDAPLMRTNVNVNIFASR